MRAITTIAGVTYVATYGYGVEKLQGSQRTLIWPETNADAHWREANAGARERAAALHLRGLGHKLAKNYKAAITAYREAVEIDRSQRQSARRTDDAADGCTGSTLLGVGGWNIGVRCAR